MNWSIDYLEDDGIVCAKTSGPADWDQVKQLSEKTLAVGRGKGTHRFLVDHTGTGGRLCRRISGVAGSGRRFAKGREVRIGGGGPLPAPNSGRWTRCPPRPG